METKVFLSLWYGLRNGSAFLKINYWLGVADQWNWKETFCWFTGSFSGLGPLDQCEFQATVGILMHSCT